MDLVKIKLPKQAVLRKVWAEKVPITSLAPGRSAAEEVAERRAAARRGVHLGRRAVLWATPWQRKATRSGAQRQKGKTKNRWPATGCLAGLPWGSCRSSAPAPGSSCWSGSGCRGRRPGSPWASRRPLPPAPAQAQAPPQPAWRAPRRPRRRRRRRGSSASSARPRSSRPGRGPSSASSLAARLVLASRRKEAALRLQCHLGSPEAGVAINSGTPRDHRGGRTRIAAVGLGALADRTARTRVGVGAGLVGPAQAAVRKLQMRLAARRHGWLGEWWRGCLGGPHWRVSHWSDLTLPRSLGARGDASDQQRNVAASKFATGR